MPQLQGERAEVFVAETEQQGPHLRTCNPIIQHPAAQNADLEGNVSISHSWSDKLPCKCDQTLRFMMGAFIHTSLTFAFVLYISADTPPPPLFFLKEF